MITLLASGFASASCGFSSNTGCKIPCRPSRADFISKICLSKKIGNWECIFGTSISNRMARWPLSFCFKPIPQTLTLDDLWSTYCSALLSLLFSKPVMHENSEEIETDTYDESGACDDLTLLKWSMIMGKSMFKVTRSRFVERH